MQIQFKSIKWGVFTASSGPETVTAAYIRGKNHSGHWVLTKGPDRITLDCDRLGAVEKAIELLTSPMATPMSKDKAEAMQQRDGCIHGVVKIPFPTLVNLTQEGIDRFIQAAMLHEAGGLTDISITPIDTSASGGIILYVSAQLKPESDDQTLIPKNGG